MVHTDDARLLGIRLELRARGEVDERRPHAGWGSSNDTDGLYRTLVVFAWGVRCLLRGQHLPGEQRIPVVGRVVAADALVIDLTGDARRSRQFAGNDRRRFVE